MIRGIRGSIASLRIGVQSPSKPLFCGGASARGKGKAGLEGAPFTLVDSITKDGKAIVGDPNAEGRFVNSTR